MTKVARFTGMTLALAAALALAGVVHAQQRRAGAGGGVDTSTLRTIEGEVVSFTAGAGTGTPQLLVRDAAGQETTFVLGPYRYLRDQGFVAERGDRVAVKAYACSACPSGLAVAEVKNLTRGLTLVLRSSDGTPVWQGEPGRKVRSRLQTGAGGGACGAGSASAAGTPAEFGHRHQAKGCGGSGPDMTRATTFTGSVKSFTGAPGAGMPTLVLDGSEGEVEMLVSPYRVLRHADFELASGMNVRVVAAPVALASGDEWVAIAITDLATGVEVALRDATTGLPAPGGRCR